jgi:hypothetical protein
MEINRLEENKIYKFLIILLVLIFIINPVGLFIISKNVLIVFFALIVAFLCSIVVYHKSLTHWSSLTIIAVIALFGLGLNAELIFRNIYSHLIIENLYARQSNYYFNKPNITSVIDDEEFQSLYMTNHFGYRIPHRNFIVKEPDWLFVGDSYTQGAQVNFPDLYTTKLSELNKNKNLLNIGISGFGLLEELEIIKDHIKHHKPEILFLQLCVLNDFNVIETRKYRIDEWIIEKSELYRYLYFRYFSEEEGLKLNNRWVLPFYKNKRDNINYNILDNRKSVIKNRIERDVSKYLNKIYYTLKKHRIKLVLILIPTKEQVYKIDLHEVISKYKIDIKNIDLDYSSDLVKYISKNKFDVIDPLPLFRKNPNKLYFKRDEHLNSHGHLELAKMINDYLKQKKH